MLQALNCLNITKLRFWGYSNCRQRTVHFSSNDTQLIRYAQTGNVPASPGSPGGSTFRGNWPAGWYTLLAGHTAEGIPQLVNSGFVDKGDLALPHGMFL